MNSYTVQINLADGQHVIETIKAKNEIDAHHKAFEKYRGKYVSSVIRKGISL